MNGKGDKDRVNDVKRYKDNYDKIFKHKSTNASRPRKSRRNVDNSKMGDCRGSKDQGIQD